MAAVGVGQLALGGAVASAAPTSATVANSNIRATKTVEPAVAQPGDTVTTTITFKSTDGGTWGLASSPDRYLEDFTDYPPAGYVLQGVTASVPRGTGGSVNNPAPYSGTPTQNASNGSVKLSWTTPSLTLAKIGGNASNTNPTLTFTYKVAEDAAPGSRSSGMSFSVSTFSNNPQTFNPTSGLEVSVEAKPSTTTVTVPDNASAGTLVSLTANISPVWATGTVQFKADGADIGAPVAVSNGVATLSHAFTASGAHPITAVFTPSGPSVTGSTAPAQTITVADVTTALSLSAPATAVSGTEVALTADVTPANAAGTVRFEDNGTAIGSPVTVSNGKAVLPHTFTSSGAHSITADFVGATGFTNASASAQSITVAAADVTTTTTLTAPQSAVTGTPATLSATVSPAPTAGTVQFKNGVDTIDGPVAVVNGVATLEHTFVTAGSASITAEYSGAAGFLTSASTPKSVSITDPDVATTLAVTGSSTATTGEATSLSATVTPSTAQGAVQFTIDGTPVGAPVTVSNGTATAPHTFGAAGTFDVAAAFTGATGFGNATAQAQSVTVSNPVVPDADTTTTVTVPTTATTGVTATLSASVTPVPAGGTVQFTVAGVNVGTPVSVDASGHASLPYTFNASGEFAVAAKYSGATGFTGSAAQSKTVTVTDPAPVDVDTSTLVGVPGTATTGADTTLSVTVQAKTGTAVPSGSVQFRDNGSPLGSPVTLDNGSASLIHAFTTAGTHQISAVYTPAAGFVGSTSTQRPVVVSAPNPTDVDSSVVITSTQPATVGTAFTVKAQVIGADTLPGTVQFFDGAVEIGQPVAVVNGIAELTHIFTASGPHQIHAVYSGGPGVAGSTSPVQVVDVTASGGGDSNGDGAGTGSLGSLSGLRFGS